MKMTAKEDYAEIDRDVPVPGRTRYGFDLMKVGDSFAVPPEDVNRVRAAACQYGRKYKRLFAVRFVDYVKRDHRCWRVK